MAGERVPPHRRRKRRDQTEGLQEHRPLQERESRNLCNRNAHATSVESHFSRSSWSASFTSSTRTTTGASACKNSSTRCTSSPGRAPTTRSSSSSRSTTSTVRKTNRQIRGGGQNVIDRPPRPAFADWPNLSSPSKSESSLASWAVKLCFWTYRGARNHG